MSTQRRTFWCVDRTKTAGGLVPVADTRPLPGERLCRVTERLVRTSNGDAWDVESVDRGPFGLAEDRRDERRRQARGAARGQ